MPTLTLYICDRAMASLRRVARETGRAVDELAEAAVEEAALRAEPKARPHARRARKAEAGTPAPSMEAKEA